METEENENNGSRSLGHSKSSSKREIYSNRQLLASSALSSGRIANFFVTILWDC